MINKNLKIGIITQARVSSTRLPGKVLRKVVNEQTLLDIHLIRARRSKLVSEFIVATTNEKEAGQILNIATRQGFKVYQGSLHDVLDRYYKAAVSNRLDVIVRITSDCPLIDPGLIDQVIQVYMEGNFDYVSNVDPPTFVDGFDVEVFSFSTLEKCWKEAQNPHLREHVTSYVIETDLFSRYNIAHEEDLSRLRLTVDNQEDFERVVRMVTEHGIDQNYKFYTKVVKDDY